MKVFACKRGGGYSGGLAIVAANNKEEAFNIFASHEDYNWILNNLDEETGEYTNDVTKCDGFYYKRADWFELPILTANVDKPQVLIENGYTE